MGKLTFSTFVPLKTTVSNMAQKPTHLFLFKLLIKIVWLKSLLISLSVYGNETYQSLCVACHGKSAEGNTALSAPALAGLDAIYLKRQLEHFQTGVRGSHPEDSEGQQMVTFAKALNAQQVSEIADYLSQLTPNPQIGSVKGDLEKGKKTYNSNCAACHGGKGEGNLALNSPALTVQGDAYLLQQLKNFKRGVRGSNTDDKFGQQMAMMARILNNEQAMKDVITYINSLGEQ